MGIDDRLREAGQRWRQSQGPVLQPPSLDNAPHDAGDEAGEDARSRRWRQGLVPVAASAAAAGIVFAIVSPHGATTGRNDVPAGTTNRPSASNRASTGLEVAVCGAAQLTGKTVRSTGEMSNELAEIALTNAGPRPCRLSGYPKLEAWGRPTGAGASSKLSISLTHGGNYFTTDPGPTTVDIGAGQSAGFALSTATAYGSELVVVDRVSIAVGPTTGSGSGHIDVAVNIGASSPPGQAIPVTVSAFAGGGSDSPDANASLTTKVKRTSIRQLTSFLNDWRTEGAFKAASKYLTGDMRPTSPSGLPVLESGQVKSSEVVTLVSEDQFTVMVVLDLKFSGDSGAWGQGTNTRFVTFTRTSPTSPYLMHLATSP